ncbi:hypothetical protein CBS101457_005561 [Exobasidium rhododendri]|nr:hypothetical protein CBS101457_005561 [Exobasidium rhododendri]
MSRKRPGSTSGGSDLQLNAEASISDDAVNAIEDRNARRMSHNGQTTSLPFDGHSSSSHTLEEIDAAQGKSHKDDKQEDSKRQATGSLSSPTHYVHKGISNYFDSALSSDQVLDSQAYNDFKGDVEATAKATTDTREAPATATIRSQPSPLSLTPTEASLSAKHSSGATKMQQEESRTASRADSHMENGSAGSSNNGLGNLRGSGSVNGSGFGSHASSSTTARMLGGFPQGKRFTTYVDGPASNRGTSSFAMMDLDESLRALYFAPLPLIVLDHTRNIKMLSRSAETIFGIDVSTSAGQRMERLVEPSSRQAFTVALNEASAILSKKTSAAAVPITTRVQMRPTEGQSSIWTDMTISSWHPTDTLFNSSMADASANRRDSEGEDGAFSPVSTDLSGHHRTASTFGPATTYRAPHEALYTISVVPSTKTAVEPSKRAIDESKESSVSSVQNTIASLPELVFQHVEAAIIYMSKDSKISFSNKSCKEIFSAFKMMNDVNKEESKSEGGKEDEEEFDFTFINEAMNCWDESFEEPFLERDWPLYKSAVLGQPSPPRFIGVEAKATGERIILEVTGKPVRDDGGYGQHIGGIISMRDVTSERLLMKNNAESQGDVYFKQTCDAMPQMVFVATPDGAVEWYSKSWYEYTGATLEDLKGTGWSSVIHEDDLLETSSRWSHVLRTGELLEGAHRCRRADGAWRWFLLRALPVHSSSGEIVKWFGTNTDIHDQVEALASSRRTQNQIKSVINHAAMTLWAVDKEGIITIAEGPGVRQLKLVQPSTPNSEKDRDFGSGIWEGEEYERGSEKPSVPSIGHTTRRSMIGRSIYSIWDVESTKDAIERALAGETIVEDMEIDGRWFRTSYTPLREQANDLHTFLDDGDEVNEADEDVDVVQGEIIGVVGASMDITDRKRAQEQIEESLLEKTRALAAEGAAREASRLKSEFLANMSHEIRTPIAGIIGLSEFLLDEKTLTPLQQDYAETIQRSAEGLLTVINDVLDFSKVEIGKLDVEQAPFNLEVLLRDAKRMLSFAAQKKDLEFRASMDLNYTGLLLGDVGRLRQVITNLLTNAIKFTAQGYISLDVAELSEDSNHLLVRFDVRDTGCGINTESLTRLFQPFSQADPSTARRFGGTGLGLSISKNLVELMNGEIGLSSVEGQGSHAWFVIPFRKSVEVEGYLEEESTPFASSSEASPSKEKSSSITKLRKDIWILIAEDNAVNARIASKNVEKMGFSCRTAGNGRLALEALGKDAYDIVLMDCQMPECDGYEATRLIRKSPDPSIRVLPVIALTASAIMGDRERAIEAGMVDYLAKPVKRPALESTLCKWLFDENVRKKLSTFVEAPSVQSPVRAPLTISTVKWNEEVQVERNVATEQLRRNTSHEDDNGKSEEDYLLSPIASIQPQRRASKPDLQALMSRMERMTGEAILEAQSQKLAANKDHSSVKGENVAAAASLMSTRSPSSDGSKTKMPSRTSQRPGRPQYVNRSQSYRNAATSPIPNPPHYAAKSRSDAGDGYQASSAFQKPLFIRRSSREQGGLGRDLEGEIAAAASAPAYFKALSEFGLKE